MVTWDQLKWEPDYVVGSVYWSKRTTLHLPQRSVRIYWDHWFSGDNSITFEFSAPTGPNPSYLVKKTLFEAVLYLMSLQHTPEVNE